MDVSLGLTPELGHRLQRAARKHGVSADEYTLRLLERHVPGDSQAADFCVSSFFFSPGLTRRMTRASNERPASTSLARCRRSSVRPSAVPHRAERRHLVSLVVALAAIRTVP